MLEKQQNSDLNGLHSRDIGQFGEDCAAEFLILRGYSIVVRNFRTAIGRNRKGVALNGEIDIIAIKQAKLCFVEVKTRSSDVDKPESAVTLRKQRQIARTARAYCRLFSFSEISCRFDVISVNARGNKAPAIRHLKDFWQPDKFQKVRWSGDVQVTG